MSRNAVPSRRRALPRVRRVSREPLSERVYREVCASIRSGAFAPGEEISLRGLAAAVGTSVMPVRDVLRRLTAEGALETTTGGRVRMPQLTAAELEEIGRLRVALEGMATEVATEKLTERALDRLEALVERQRRLAPMPRRQYLELNAELHNIIYDAAGMPTLRRMIDALWIKLGPMMNTQTTGAHHQRAIAALRRRDAAGARRHVEEDIREGTGVMLAALASTRPADSRGEAHDPG